MNTSQNRAIIIGYSGQDGRLLSRHLKSLGSRILGIGSKTLYSSDDEKYQHLNHVDITSLEDVVTLVKKFKPNEIYYLAAFHHSSQDKFELTPVDFYNKCYSIHVLGLINFLEAIRTVCQNARLFYSSSSLIYSGNDISLITEKSAYSPFGFYAMTKMSGMQLCKEYRENYQIFASVGILFNHESSFRSLTYLSQKIIRSAIRISKGFKEDLVIGDLRAQVDWGYAPDYVKAFKAILNCKISDDFIVASGEAHTVQEFIEITFNYLGLDWRAHVIENNKILLRRLPVKIGNTSYLQSLTSWRYSRSFKDMVEQLVRDTQECFEQTIC